MKLKHLIPIFLLALCFSSCEKKEEEKAPAKVEEKATPASKQPTTQQPAKKTGIPAVEASRKIGHDLDRQAQESRDLLKKANP